MFIFDWSKLWFRRQQSTRYLLLWSLIVFQKQILILFYRYDSCMTYDSFSSQTLSETLLFSKFGLRVSADLQDVLFSNILLHGEMKNELRKAQSTPDTVLDNDEPHSSFMALSTLIRRKPDWFVVNTINSSCSKISNSLILLCPTQIKWKDLKLLTTDLWQQLRNAHFQKSVWCTIAESKA